ncbi:ribonuclease H-like domain-containing protein [Mycena metata]|uniref:Ribonuclease H-like domain-containing protein n=1 Tax=Mycena metata TaxID=1033252 RepID=A0AAD7IZL0_9AGAR|nr:ribonuclease H-like domain-containing protein [Mycena metata]
MEYESSQSTEPFRGESTIAMYEASEDPSTQSPAEPAAADTLRSVPASPTIFVGLPGDTQTEEDGEGPALTAADVESLSASMIAMGQLNIATVTYVITEAQANHELVNIVDGVIGLDTEFVKRTLYGDEAIIDNMPIMGASAKKTARLAIQYLESMLPTFSIQWENTGLCLIQLAQGESVWVLNMNRIKAFPSELRRILESPDIAKAGAGILSDGCVLWEDLRCNAKNLVDVGLITRLWAVPTRHKEEPFSNLALDTATFEVMTLTLDKTFQTTVNWKLEPNRAHIIYAAIDAAAALRVHELLAPDMAAEEANPETTFSTDWYTFNCTLGDAMRIKRSIRGAEVPWSMKDCTWFSNNKFQGKYY